MILNTEKNNNTHNIFKCTMCGQCCKGYGGTYISHENAKEISLFLGISYEDFIMQYTKPSKNRFLLVQQKNKFCIFWDNNKACLIHPVKPNMCRRWPFIQSVLNDINNWNIMANSCPGIKTNIESSKIISCVKSHIDE